MQPYRLHMFAIGAWPFVFALSCAWVVKHRSPRDLWKWGLAVSAALVILIIVFPNIGTYYHTGGRSAEETAPIALPLSTLLITGLQLAAARIRMPLWASVPISAIAGEWPIVGMSAIA
jgi:hypothetical protein